MVTKNMGWILVLGFLLMNPVHAQDQAPAKDAPQAQTEEGTTLPSKPAQANQSRPPSSGLGKSVAEPPTVVYPNIPDVVEDAVRDVEDLQLTPEQRDRLKRVYIEREKQKASPYPELPKPITRTAIINLDPGISPPILRLARGQLTSIVFSDLSGQPWFIESVSMNRTLFNDGRVGGNAGGAPAKTNVLSIEPMQPAAYGNVTIQLRGLSTPVIFMLSAGQGEVDMRIDAKIPGRNPDSTASVSVSNMPSIDSDLTYFLDGVPPKEAKRLKVSGLTGTEAWQYRNSLYIRVRADAQYPAYIAAARSTNGISVYKYGVSILNSATFTTGGRAVTVFLEP